MKRVTGESAPYLMSSLELEKPLRRLKQKNRERVLDITAAAANHKRRDADYFATSL